MEESSLYDTVGIRPMSLSTFFLFQTLHRSASLVFLNLADRPQGQDRWCLSENVNKDYVILHQLVLVEEFKNCLPTELKTYVDEQKVESVHQAAMLADDYALTHMPVFRHPGDPQPRKGNLDNLPSDGKNTSRPSNDLPVRQSLQFPGGPACCYCKKKGHVMSECRVLQKKNQRVEPDCLIAPNSVDQTELLEDVKGKGGLSFMGVAKVICHSLYP